MHNTVIVSSLYGPWPDPRHPELSDHYVQVFRSRCPTHVTFELMSDRKIRDTWCINLPDWLVEKCRAEPKGIWGKLYAFSRIFPVGTRVFLSDLDNVFVNWDRILRVPLGTFVAAGITPHDFAGGLVAFTVSEETYSWWDTFEKYGTTCKNDEEWMRSWTNREYKTFNELLPGAVRLWLHEVESHRRVLPSGTDAVLFYRPSRPHLIDLPWNPFYVGV